MGIAVLKGSNDSMLKSNNRGIKMIRLDGTYERIYDKWLKKQYLAFIKGNLYESGYV